MASARKPLPPSRLTLKKTQVGDPLAAAPDAAADGSRVVPIDQVVPDPANLRRALRDLDGLAASIKARGILQPLTVRPADDGDGDGAYVIVIGHRRHAAAKLAGLAEVPVIVQRMAGSERLEAMLMENLLRDDLTPLEEAQGYRDLAAAGRSQRQIAERLGRSQSHISKRLSLLKLPPAATDVLASGEITLEEALALVGLADQGERLAAVLREVLDARRRGEAVHLEMAIDRELRRVERERHGATTSERPRAERSPDDTPSSEIRTGADRRERGRGAQRGRAEAMEELVRGQPTREGTIDFVLRQALAAMLPAIDEHRAGALLGLPSPTADRERSSLEAFAEAGSEQLLRAVLAVVLVRGEELAGDLGPQGAADPEVVRHLAYLQEQGRHPEEAAEASAAT